MSNPAAFLKFIRERVPRDTLPLVDEAFRLARRETESPNAIAHFLALCQEFIGTYSAASERHPGPEVTGLVTVLADRCATQQRRIAKLEKLLGDEWPLASEGGRPEGSPRARGSVPAAGTVTQA